MKREVCAIAHFMKLILNHFARKSQLLIPNARYNNAITNSPAVFMAQSSFWLHFLVHSVMSNL